MRTLLASLLLFPAALVAQAPGPLFIVGGGPQPPALVQEFVDLAGGRGRARIVVFPMATASATAGDEKARDLQALGATAFSLRVTREQADTDSVARLLDGVTGVWFVGGDQNRLARALRGTRTLEALKRRWRAGAVVGGTSAGAAVMSATMLTGDEKRPGGSRPLRDSTADDAWLTIDRGNVAVDSGFALLPNAIVDQHFLRRKRHNRLISLVLERPERLGVGIDESTALVVEGSGQWRVSGTSVAVIYDARDAIVAPSGTPAVSGLRMHVLPAGGRFDPATGRATLP